MIPRARQPMVSRPMALVTTIGGRSMFESQENARRHSLLQVRLSGAPGQRLEDGRNWRKMLLRSFNMHGTWAAYMPNECTREDSSACLREEGVTNTLRYAGFVPAHVSKQCFPDEWQPGTLRYCLIGFYHQSSLDDGN